MLAVLPGTYNSSASHMGVLVLFFFWGGGVVVLESHGCQMSSICGAVDDLELLRCSHRYLPTEMCVLGSVMALSVQSHIPWLSQSISLEKRREEYAI